MWKEEEGRNVVGREKKNRRETVDGR